MCVTICGVFLVIRARYVEEKKKLLARSVSSDVITETSDMAGLLEGKKEDVELEIMEDNMDKKMDRVMEEKMEDGRVGITFEVNEQSMQFFILLHLKLCILIIIFTRKP